MPELTFETTIPASAEALFAWHMRRGAFERLVPPWESVELKKFEGVAEGQQAVLQIGMGPARLTWVAEHHDVKVNRQFRDVQVKGPFRAWEHTHRMEPDGPDQSRLIDHIIYAVPLGAAGERVAGRAILHRLQRQFAYRHRITRQDLAAFRRYHPGWPLRVAISGTSGLIGSNLVAYLRAGGHAVWRLVRRRTGAADAIYWNYREQYIDAGKLEGLDAVIHLAGENVFALRWSEQKKMAIYNSRVQGTRFLAEALAGLQQPPAAFLTASGTGIYGDRGDEVLTEDAPPGERGFFTVVCRDWEQAAQPAADAGMRTVSMRIGVVLTPQGGALGLMYLPFSLGLGARIGSAHQYIPWIALDDVLQSIYHLLVNDKLEGPVNLVAPQPVTMRMLVQTLAEVLARPACMTIPAPLVRLLSGEAAEEMVLSSARVHPERLKAVGYSFFYPDLKAALQHQLGRTQATSPVPQPA